jgi:hypothetical protein
VTTSVGALTAPITPRWSMSRRRRRRRSPRDRSRAASRVGAEPQADHAALGEAAEEHPLEPERVEQAERVAAEPLDGVGGSGGTSERPWSRLS